jgi:GH35 family endo-1,4-beta-xylanase
VAVYQQQFSTLFNYGTVGVYWDLIQSVKHIADWAQVKPEIEWATKQGLKLKGHPLVWGCERAGTPRWLPRQKTDLQVALNERVREAVTRHRGQITTWDVVNEPLEKGLFDEILGSEYLRQAFTTARIADPNAQLVVNEYGILGAQSVKRDPYFALLKKFNDEGVPFDAVGIQAHEPRDEWFDPTIVSATLNRFAELGKAIHLTEFTAQADSRAAITGGYRTGKWDRAKQAEYFTEFYTICFGHPQVEAITVWGLDDERAWIKECALLDRSWLPKQAWRALDQLLNLKWRTSTETMIEKEEYRLRGFYGEYEVKVTLKNQKEIKQQFPLRRGEKNEWLIRI